MFNSHSGYLEGVLRGFKAGLITQSQYANLTQCETIDDFRMQLAATDYGNFLANETPPISTSTIADRATNKLVDEFNYIRSNSVQPLTKFLDYMTCVVPSLASWIDPSARVGALELTRGPMNAAASPRSYTYMIDNVRSPACGEVLPSSHLARHRSCY